MNYRPLPDNLTIKKSDVEGLGIFATENISVNTKLGLTHYEVDKMLLRTPLGGFYNHSDNPNCVKYRVGFAFFLMTIKDIKEGEELTVTYTLYGVNDESK